MPSGKLNDVIGERQFYLAGAANPAVILRVGRPYQDESGYYRCPFQFLDDDGDNDVMVAAGVDALDALITALGMIGTTLNYRNRTIYDGRLYWLKGTDDLHLPTIESGWKGAAEEQK